LSTEDKREYAKQRKDYAAHGMLKTVCSSKGGISQNNVTSQNSVILTLISIKTSNLVHAVNAFDDELVLLVMKDLNNIINIPLLIISSRIASTLTVLTKDSYGLSQFLQADVKIALQTLSSTHFQNAYSLILLLESVQSELLTCINK
jgi:hypothetical protein